MQLNIRLMLSFDANKDGLVTRDEVEAGLRVQFEAADTDHNGSLNLSEIQAENARRWQASGTGSSPLIDWNQDGTVSFAEFSGTAHSVFAQLDRDRAARLRASNWRRPAFGGSFGRRRPATRDAKATWALEMNFPGAPNLSSLKGLKEGGLT